MTGRMAGQTINDRLLAARHSLAGQGLAKSVCKATTEEMIGPKKKHLDYLVHCTNEPNVSIPQLANLLIERSQNTNWVVVYKALITVHHVMCYGNERFTQYLASSNSTFQLSNFLDKSGVQGLHNVKTGYDMSPFIRRYARYLNEKALSYRTVAFDFCKVKRGKEDGLLRTMNAEKLLKTLPTLQNQLDALLDFDCSANDLTNGVINMSFMLLFRDLIRLFACYNDGIINLLEKYFDMNKKQCRDALDIYKKFLTRMDRVGEFLKVAENVGIDKGDIPDLTKAPSSLLDALEQHLASIEGKKSSNTTTPSQSTNQKNVRSAVSALSSTSNAFGTVVANGRLDSHSNGIDENLKLKALAEEEAAMNQFKSKVSPTAANNPFLTSSSASSISSQPAVDLFAAEPIASTPGRASDDLLQLGNPFVFSQPPVNNPPTGFSQPNNIWITNGNGYPVQQPVSPVISNGAFVTESNFSSVFGNNDTSTAEDTIVPPSYNPFLIDDPTPSLLLDPDSPTNTKPIHNVLSYFQKESDFYEINAQNLADKSNQIVYKKDEEYHISQKNICDKKNKVCSSNPENTDNNTILQSNFGAVKKCVPPPRPPPPIKKLNEPLTINCETSILTNPSVISENLTDNNFPSVFTANEGLPVVSQNIDGNLRLSGGVLQPTSLQGNQSSLTPNTTSNNNNNQQTSSALLTGDLESSLASLAENLSINNRPPPVKGVQWNSPKNSSKMGNNWTPQPMSATTGAGYKPMNQSLINPQPTTIQPPVYPQLQPMMGMRPMATNATLLPQLSGMPSAASTTNTLGQQQSLLFH